MFNRIKIVLIIIFFSAFLNADINNTNNNNVEVNLSKMSKKEFANSDYIRIRFMRGNPTKMTRIICKQICKKECIEPVELNSRFALAWLYKKNKSKSIGMTETARSIDMGAKGSSSFNALNYFEEHEFQKSGEFYFFKSLTGSTHKREVSFNVVLLAGHEYEIDTMMGTVLMINSDGSTTKVKTSFPSKCGAFDSKERIFPVLR